MALDMADDQPMQWRGRDVVRGGGPYVWGILNVTPDSFSDGGLYFKPEDAQDAARRMLDEGADILDIGGESTRPGAAPIEIEEEWRRVGPVIAAVKRAVPAALVSVDTYKSEVARRALDAGADIVNDISADRMDPALWDVVAEARCGYILMHMQGTPATMQMSPHYNDCVREVGEFLAQKITALDLSGIVPERVIPDPGIGFGKRLKDNLTLLANLAALQQIVGRPLLVGPSRKRFIGDVLGVPVEERLEGTLAACALAVWQGAAIIRVHDVRPARRACDLAAAIRAHKSS